MDDTQTYPLTTEDLKLLNKTRLGMSCRKIEALKERQLLSWIY